jgi:hypothetical protein
MSEANMGPHLIPITARLTQKEAKIVGHGRG